MQTNSKISEFCMVIIAAGGIVEKHTPQGTRIAVIHRDIYGEEWALPKGKQEQGESIEETALREVSEETGCQAELCSFAGHSFYYHDNTPKIVFFWKMISRSDCPFVPSAEVKDIAWLSPEKALDRLTHSEERRIIAEVYALNNQPDDTILPFFSRMQKKYEIFSAKTISRRRWLRLSGSIKAYKKELNCREKVFHNQNTVCDSCIIAAREALQRAEIALEQGGDIDLGWKYLMAAQRMEVFSMNQSQLQAKSIVMLNESEKLDGWRKDSARDLLSGKNTSLTSETVYQAALIIDEHYMNQAYKDGLLRSHIVNLTLILSAQILFMIYFHEEIKTVFASQSEFSLSNPWMFKAVLLFGLLGGTVSAILAAPKSTRSTRVPEMANSIRVTLLRILLGTVLALIFVIILRCGLGEFILNQEIFSKIKQNNNFLLLTAFASGFSERLVLNALRLFWDKKQE